MEPTVPPRVFVALAVSAVVPAVALGVLSPLTGGTGHKDRLAILELALFFYAYAAAYAVALGVPTFLLFRRLGILRWWTTVLAGYAIGIVTMTIATFQIPPPRALLLYGALGAASALVFWAIWTRAPSGSPYDVPNDA